MNIESIDQSFLPAMATIVEACRTEMGLGAELNWNETSLRSAMSTGRVLGATDGSHLLGFLLYIDITADGDGALPGAEILCLATHPQFQGQGVMSNLLKNLQARASEIWLEVHEGNQAAITFYKNKGFQELGRRKKYYKDGRDALLFSWVVGKH